MGLPSAVSGPTLRDLAALVDRAGLDSVWIPENPGLSGAFASAGAVAMATSRADVCIGTVSPFTRNPVVLAMEIAQLQRLSGGRAVVALGAGPEQTYRRWGIDPSGPYAAMTEVLQVVRRLTRGETVTYAGRYVTLESVALARPPGRDRSPEEATPPGDARPLDSDVPLYFGAMGPRLVAAAGRLADGLVVSMHAPVSLIERTAAQARAARARGAAPLRVVALTQLSLAATPGEAARALKPSIGATIARIAGNPAVERIFTGDGPLDADGLARIARHVRAGRPAGELIPDALVEELCVSGDRERVAQRIARLREAGVDELVFHDLAPGNDAAAAIAAVTELTGR